MKCLVVFVFAICTELLGYYSISTECQYPHRHTIMSTLEVSHTKPRYEV